METIDIIVLVCLAAALLVLYSCDHSFKEIGDFLVITLTVIVVLYWVLVIWIFAVKYLLLCVAFLLFSYFGLCVGAKKYLNGKLYILVFVMTSILLITSVCMVFGSYHILSQYKNLPVPPGVSYLFSEYNWSRTDLKRAMALLLTGFKHFFVSIDEVKLSDVHLLQKAVGVVLTFIVGWCFTVIKSFFVKENISER